MRRPLPLLELATQDGRRLEASTTAADAGPWIVALSTAVPDLALEVSSTYLGGPGLSTRVNHLQLSRGNACLFSREANALRVDLDRSSVILDHAASVLEAAQTQLPETVVLDVDEEALGVVVAATLLS